MSKRKASTPPDESRPQRKTRSSGPLEEAPPLPLPPFFQVIRVTYRSPSRLHFYRSSLHSSLQSQTFTFEISKQLSKNENERNIISQRIKSKAQERIGITEASADPRPLTQAEYETLVGEIGEQEGVGVGDQRTGGWRVPNLNKRDHATVWEVRIMSVVVRINATDFEMEVLTNRRLEELVPPEHRSASFKRAIDSNDVELRTMSYLTTQACLTADGLHPRADSLWNEKFLLELNKYRKPLRRIVYQDYVKLTRDEYEDRIALHCKLYQAALHTQSVWFSSQVGIRSEELNEIFERFLVLQESEELTWEEVTRVHQKWKDGMTPPVGMTIPDEKLQAAAETSAMSLRVHLSVRSATDRVDQYRGATEKQRHALSKYIVKKFVSPEEDKGGGVAAVKMETIKNCLTGESLLSLPASGTVQEVRKWVSNSDGYVSIDHFDQMVIGLVNGEVIPIMNSRLNVGPVSPELNSFKFRWNTTQLVFMFAGMSIAEETNGVVEDNTALLESHSRLLKMAKAAYKSHRMPCPRYLRSTLPVSRIKDVLVVNTSILELLDVEFAMPLPTFSDYLQHLGISHQDFDEFADRQLQEMSDEEYVETGAQLDIDARFPVRPGTNLKTAVYPSFESDIHGVSKSLDTEFKNKYNMTFNKTREGEGAGIIALTSNGTESVQNVCQLLLKWHKSELKDRLGLHGQNPWVTLYANSICFVAHSILKQRKNQKFDEPTQVYFHDPVNPGLPLDVPPDSKHPFMPSICSNNHPKHLHGWKVKNPKIEDLTFEGWRTSRNTMRLATAASNMADGQGDSTFIKNNRESLRRSISHFRSDVDTGFDKLVETLLDPGAAGDAFVDKVLAGIKAIDDSRSIAPPPSAAAQIKRSEKEEKTEGDSED